MRTSGQDIPADAGRLLQRTLSAPADVNSFRTVIWEHYRTCGRSFPWRAAITPYRVFVSEVMLQQTQTQRVAVKYRQFIKTFPTFTALADAPLRDVLELWKGLGYNRRALALKRAAGIVREEHGGRLPRSEEALAKLPGIGKATAAAIVAFAFNHPSVFVETNIRTVYIHFFFADRHAVRDSEILPLVAATLDRSNPRTWYYALMDYGVMLKQTAGNASRRSAHYSKQSPFKGSRRQKRGVLLKTLVESGPTSGEQLAAAMGWPPSVVEEVARDLERDGLIRRRSGRLSIA